MKDFHIDVNDIIDTVHSALRDAGLDDIGHDIDISMQTGSKGVTVERDFQVGDRAELVLRDVHQGRVTVEAGESGVIHLRVDGRRAGSTDAAELLEVSQEGNHVVVRPRGRYQASSLHCHVRVPRDCDVHVRSLNADVTVQATGGALQLETVGGDIALTDVRGECTIRTVSGDIQGTNVAGVLTVHTTSGDTRVMGSSLRSFNLHSTSGDFQVETPLTLGEQYLMSTMSGDMRLLVSGSTGATVHFRTANGDFVTDLPAEIVKAGKRVWQGRVNGGGATLDVSSMSGDLHIERSAASAPADDRPAEAATAPEPSHEAVREPVSSVDQTNEILAALERGEISVEDAMARLDDLPAAGSDEHVL